MEYRNTLSSEIQSSVMEMILTTKFYPLPENAVIPGHRTKALERLEERCHQTYLNSKKKS